ncbi:hypothetical protein ACFVH6_41750 [Spirillospora sp. NPDC127200]
MTKMINMVAIEFADTGSGPVPPAIAPAPRWARRAAHVAALVAALSWDRTPVGYRPSPDPGRLTLRARSGFLLHVPDLRRRPDAVAEGTTTAASPPLPTTWPALPVGSPPPCARTSTDR